MEEYNVDLVVAGGGFAGVCAAIAAARKGLDTVLIQDRPVFGGNSSSEIMVGINGASALGHSPSVYAREGGICEELRLAMAHFANSRDLAYFETIYKEKNLKTYLNTYVDNVEMRDGKIESVTAVQLGSEKKFRFFAPMFVDSTGDGGVAYKAGAEFMYGREAKSEFNESLAPDKADDYTLGDTLMFDSRYEKNEVKYVRPDFAYDVTKLPFFKNLDKEGLERHFYRNFGDDNFHSFWWLEYGGQVDTVSDNEEITFELRKLVYGLWDYIKNSGNFEDVERLNLFHVAPVVGKRESRRFVGDYVYNQNDVDAKKKFPNAVATAGWEMDVHAPKGVYDDEPATIWHYVAGVLDLPFSMMYSKNVPNLMFAGRDASSTHIAFGTTRLAATGGTMGQAVGTAAYLCKKYNETPRGINEKHIDELRKLLYHDDQFIIGYNDTGEKELYEDLTVSASTVKEYSNEIPEGVIKLDNDLGIAMPIKNRLDTFEIKLKNNENDTVLQYEVYEGERKENYIPSKIINQFSIDIKAGFDSWLKLPVNAMASEDDKIYIVFKSNAQLDIYGTNTKLTGVVSFRPEKLILHTNPRYAGAMRIMRTALYKELPVGEICFRNVEPNQDMYGVENLTDGYNRPYGLPHIWISKSKWAEGEQKISFCYSKPKRIEKISLTFNTELEHDQFEEMPKSLVTDYDIYVYDSLGKELKYTVRNNYKRVCTTDIHCDDVMKFEVVLKENNGSEFYEIYDIKLV